MKIRTIRYVLKQGVVNSYRNKLMTLASVSTVAASLVIFGIFLVLVINLNYNMKLLTSQPEMEIFLKPEVKNDQATKIEDKVKNDPNIESYTKVSKEEALEKAKKLMGDNAKLLEGEDSSFLPESFIVKLKDSLKSDEVANEYKKLTEVDDVTYYMEVINLIAKLNRWVRLIAIIVLAILLLVSIFIISNTIKLTVFARRKEINIMKYIGATDWFIRWPFVVEGVVIGILGAALAFILIGYGYNSLEVRFNQDLLSVGGSMIKILKINEFGVTLFNVYLGVGSLVGILGSMLSIRKYLRV
jgi:Cell division protein